MDNIVMQTLGKLFDLVVLNIVFIISCIPVFTIGTSISSLYTVTLKIVRKKNHTSSKAFLRLSAPISGRAQSFGSSALL